MAILFYLTLLFISIWILSSIVIWSLRNGISPMPSSPKAKKLLLANLPAKVNGTIYELGSGWGTLALPVAQFYPQHTVIGYETSPFPLIYSKLRKWLAGQSNLSLKRTNFFQSDLSDSGLVICYLYPAAMEKLAKKLEKELKPGTWVISNTFALPGWKAHKTLTINDIYHTQLYIYRL